MEPKKHSEPAERCNGAICPGKNSIAWVLTLLFTSLIVGSALADPDPITSFDSSLSSFPADTCDTRRDLDWDLWPSGTRPNREWIIDDGVRVLFEVDDPLSVLSIFGVFAGVEGQSLVVVQNENTPSDTSSMLISFSRPVEQLTFDLSDIDISAISQDRFSVDAYSGGVLINLTATHYLLGADVSYMGNNTFQGDQFHGADLDRHRVRFGFEESLDSLRITYQQGSTVANPGAHDYRIGDLSWCKLPNDVPFASDFSGGQMDTLFLNATTDVAEQFCLTNLMDPDQDTVFLSNWVPINFSGPWTSRLLWILAFLTPLRQDSWETSFST